MWLLVLALNAPGQLSSDSIYQMTEGITGVYASMHPPVMSALLGLLYRVFPGTGLYLLIASTPFFVALLLVSTNLRPRIWPLIALVCLMLSPLVLIYQGIVWKDVLFANLVAGSFASVTAGDRARQDGRKGAGAAWILASIGCAAIAILVRQNGAIMLPFLGLSLGALAIGPGRLHAALGLGIGSVVLAILCAWGVSALVSATAVSHVDYLAVGLRSLEQYDMAGIAAGQAVVAPSVPGVDAATVQHYLDALGKNYSPERDDTLSDVPALVPFDRSGDHAMRGLWWQLVIRHPAAYLVHRFQFYRWLLFPPQPRRCLPFHVGIAGPPAMLARLGLNETARPGDRALSRYGNLFLNSPLYWNGAWLLLAAGLLLGFARHIRSDLPVACLLASSICIAASYLLVGIACDMRYCYVVPVAVAVALARLTGTRSAA
ncbi:MAG TPA: hypothetical protein VIZ17_11275 [Acetobacteraceae bacterium]